MDDKDGNKIIKISDLLNLINVMEKNISSLSDDGNFYDYDENGNKIELDVSLPLNNNANVVTENPLFKSVFLVENVKIDYENLNVFDFFQKNIEQITSNIVKEKIYKNYESPYLKEIKSCFETNQDLLLEIMFREYFKSYSYVYSLIETGEDVRLDVEKKKLIIETPLKKLSGNDNVKFLSINKNNFEENIELILLSIMNYSENIGILTNKVFSNTENLNDEFLLTTNANKKIVEVITPDIAFEEMKNINDVINKIKAIKDDLIKIDGEFFKSYKIEEIGLLYNALFNVKLNDYQLILKTFFHEMDTNTLFDYMLKNEIKEKVLMLTPFLSEGEVESAFFKKKAKLSKLDEDNSDEEDDRYNNYNNYKANRNKRLNDKIKEEEEIRNKEKYLKEVQFKVSYYDIFLEKVLDKINDFNIDFLSTKKESEQIIFGKNLIQLCIKNKNNIPFFTIQQVANVIKNAIYLSMKNGILEFNEKSVNNSFLVTDIKNQDEFLEYYKVSFAGAEKTVRNVLSELALLENISLSSKVKNENIYKITVDRDVFETVFPSLKEIFKAPSYRDEYNHYGEKEEKIEFNNLDYVSKEDEISFLIELEKDVSKYFEIKTLFQKLKISLEKNDGSKDNNTSIILDRVFAEEILQTKLRFKDSQRDPLDVKRDIKPRAKI